MTPQDQLSICVGCKWAKWKKGGPKRQMSGHCMWLIHNIEQVSTAARLSDKPRIHKLFHSDHGIGWCPVRKPEEPTP